MDWDAAIERNREALKRVLASLLVRAGLAGAAAFTSPLWGGRRSSDRRVGVAVALQPPPDASRRPPHKGEVDPARPNLPRHLHRAILRLLRPAESAARRLIIVAARDLVAELPPARPRKPSPASPQARKMGKTSALLRGRVGTGIIMPPRVPHPEVRGDPELRACRGVEGQPRRTLCLPLTDPLPRWRAYRQPARNSVPRISVPGFVAPFPVAVRVPPAPGDPIDASRLALRLQALGRALDDLPKQARRFARWRANRDRSSTQGKIRRLSPLRPGRPPGQSAATRRRPAHEIHDVLADLQYFARKALEAPDTS